MKNWGFARNHNNIENWPKLENGEPVRPVLLEHVNGSQLNADMELNLLQAYDIPCFAACPADGDFGKIMLGFSGYGTEIYVPETLLEDAMNILSCDIEHVEDDNDDNE